jgi:uncharacterized repeat protein (TIGR01451 family)
MLFAALVAGAACPSPVRAADENVQAEAEVTGSGPLDATIVVEKLLVRKGPGDDEVRLWVPARRLSAGDEVHYTVRVRNPGKEAVTEVVVTKRLPFGVRYELGSATGPACAIQLSTDGGRTFATPDIARGKKGPRKPATVEYTHVRWVLAKPLAPGATALLRFRATFA